MVKLGLAKTSGGGPFGKIKDKYSNAVVSIDMNYPRSFGLDPAGSSTATGFIVDKAQGLLLTNKHVVTEGPVRAKAKFLRNEEVDLKPIYRDPVHDYALFRFNPADVTETPLEEIKLDPAGAIRGTNVLIIGNNGGEKLSYIESTIARVDRPCVPMLDQNSFYITASDTGVGGSSGAPMLNKEGKAVAMVAAGDDYTNISLYIPLFRAARCVELIRQGKPVPRGTIQVAWKHKTFEEVKRYDVPDNIIQTMKKAAVDENEMYMLTVEKLLPKGPAHDAGVRNGDVLYKINGKMIHTYIEAEALLDDNIGKKMKMEFIRDGKEISFDMVVQDLEDISPKEFIEVSNSIVNNLQYLLAMQFALPMEGVFLAKTGYMFRSVPRASIIMKIGRVETPDLVAFKKAIVDLPNGKLVSVKYLHVTDQNKTHIATVTVDKRWYPFQSAVRDDTKGEWKYTNCSTAGEETQQSKKAPNVDLADSSADESESYIGNALTYVEFSSPFAVDGEAQQYQWCCGIIVDKQLGLIVCERETISTFLGDVQVTFNASKTISAEVIFVHPLQRYSIIRYDPSLLENDTTVTVAEVKLSSERVKIGTKLDFFGITSSQNLYQAEAQARQVLDLRAEDGASDDHTFKPLPFEVLNTQSSVGTGVLTEQDTDKTVALCLTSGKTAMLTTDILPVIMQCQAAISQGEAPPKEVRTLPVNLKFIPLSEARNIRDLSDEWAMQLMKSSDAFQRKVLTVSRKMMGTDSYAKLEDNDLILSLNDTPVTLVTKYHELIGNSEAVKVSVLRNGEVVNFDKIETTSFSTLGTTRIVVCCGLVLQEPHPSIFYLTSPEKIGDGGIYVTNQERGSPAENAEQQDVDFSETSSIRGKLIFKVDNTAVTTLDEFVDAVIQKKHAEYVRFTAKNIENGELSVHSIRLDLEYW
eukprot:CAMPEP_0184042620 /NCGR_PEP_ID=MMETSP0955-20130417/66449_1 /TAXON_ID=627963 /ORGANISM="Aplanochytrium sp, Strain PBS07" /LENGTH=920 /DNA_ID=CAMNT_0026333405 /DNA_START=166 /DNA_END=2926 /DNA_ORIENTATION=-